MKHKLTAEDFITGARYGVDRYELALRRGLRELNPMQERSEFEALCNNIAGAMAELCYARMTGQAMSVTMNRVRNTPDFGTRDAVRHTRYASGHLLVYASEPEHWRYYLAVGDPPLLTWPGWIDGADARAVGDRRASAGGAVYWIPQRRLQPWPDSDLHKIKPGW